MYLNCFSPKLSFFYIIGRTDDHLRANRKLVEKELYPKDLIDSYLEWFILSPEDHEALRSKENVRQHMAHSFLEKIVHKDSIEKGSMARLHESFQRDQNCILMHLSKLLDSVLQNGISHIIGILFYKYYFF